MQFPFFHFSISEPVSIGRKYFSSKLIGKKKIKWWRWGWGWGWPMEYGWWCGGEGDGAEWKRTKDHRPLRPHSSFFHSSIHPILRSLCVLHFLPSNLFAFAFGNIQWIYWSLRRWAQEWSRIFVGVIHFHSICFIKLSIKSKIQKYNLLRISTFKNIEN